MRNEEDAPANPSLDYQFLLARNDQELRLGLLRSAFFLVLFLGMLGAYITMFFLGSYLFLVVLACFGLTSAIFWTMSDAHTVHWQKNWQARLRELTPAELGLAPASADWFGGTAHARVLWYLSRCAVGLWVLLLLRAVFGPIGRRGVLSFMKAGDGGVAVAILFLVLVFITWMLIMKAHRVEELRK